MALCLTSGLSDSWKTDFGIFLLTRCSRWANIAPFCISRNEIVALHRLAFIFLCLPLMASAAPFTSPGDRDLIRDRQQRLLDEQRKRLEELQQLPGKGAPAAADASGDDERCFEIRRIELEGAGHLGESARRQLLAPTRGAAWASASSMRCSRPSPTITWIAATSPPVPTCHSRTWPPRPCASSSSKAAWRAWTAPRWPARANWR